MSITYYSCKGCQWEHNCEFSCPCEHYCGYCDDIDKEIDYAVAKFEMIEGYARVESDFTDYCVE